MEIKIKKLSRNAQRLEETVRICFKDKIPTESEMMMRNMIK